MTPHGTGWRVRSDVRAAYSEDGAVLLDIDSGVCYSLNTVASRIWQAIDSNPGIRLKDIVADLQARFEVATQQLETDASECLGNLERLRLIDRHEAERSTSAAQIRK